MSTTTNAIRHTEKEVIPVETWKQKAIALYGPNKDDWKFKCPHCSGIQTLAEFKAHNVPDPQDKFFFSCIGRWVAGRGCDWTLGGLFQIHTTEVIAYDDSTRVPVFEFAD